MMVERAETVAPIRDTIAKLSEEFDGGCWHKKERERRYSKEFVERLAELGLLA